MTSDTVTCRILTDCVCVSFFLSDTECFQESEHLKESLKCCLLHLFGAIVAGDQVGGASLDHVSNDSYVTHVRVKQVKGKHKKTAS